MVLLFQATPVLALPQGETVAHGEVTITREGDAMTVNQVSGKAIVNYSSFDIAQPESVQFNQPSAGAAILNRVNGGGSSTIAGQMSANGRVFLINPNGILFTASAQVDVGALVASALQHQRQRLPRQQPELLGRGRLGRQQRVAQREFGVPGRRVGGEQRQYRRR